MENIITFITETGQTIPAMVMGTIEDDSTGKNYVLYTSATGNDPNMYVASFDPEQEDEMILIHAVESEEEWQRVGYLVERLREDPENYKNL